jgi:hypothetical protein
MCIPFSLHWDKRHGKNMVLLPFSQTREKGSGDEG